MGGASFHSAHAHELGIPGASLSPQVSVRAFDWILGHGLTIGRYTTRVSWQRAFPQFDVNMNAIMKGAARSKSHQNDRRIAARPNKPKDAYPDFALLRRNIFGKRRSRTTGASLASEERGTY